MKLQLISGVICIYLNEIFLLYYAFCFVWKSVSGDLNNLNFVGYIFSVFPPILSLGIGFGLAKLKQRQINREDFNQ